MAAERDWLTYTSDAAVGYEVLVPAWVLGISGHGFGAYDGTKASKPRQLHMRYITLTSTTTGRHRKLHIGSPTAPAYATLGTTFSLPNIDGTSENYVSTGRVGEALRRGPHA